MKYLKYFDNKQDYTSFFSSSDFIRPNVSFTEDSDITYFNPVLTPKDVAGSIVLWDNVNNKKVFVYQEKLTIEKYPISRYTPIGVVVVPRFHDVYGTGECGVMSLTDMSDSTPDAGYIDGTGYGYAPIYWGNNKIDTELTNFDKLPKMGSTKGVPTETITGTCTYGYLSIDVGDYLSPSGNICPHNTNTVYPTGTADYSIGWLPSPYLTDGSRNAMYFSVESPSVSTNAFSDFNGSDNTKILTSLHISQPNWKTDSEITHSSSAGYYPAACCCWRFHTVGTKQGDWYLPSCGELGYIMPKFNIICKSIDMIKNYYTKTDINISQIKLSNYWSSTESSSSVTKFIDINSGRVDITRAKSSTLFVRAFLRSI